MRLGWDEVFDLSPRRAGFPFLGRLSFGGLVELTPLLLGPPKLLHGGRQVEEMDGNDGCPRPQISVADQGIQLPAGLDETLVDQLETLGLLGAVATPG